MLETHHDLFSPTTHTRRTPPLQTSTFQANHLSSNSQDYASSSWLSSSTEYNRSGVLLGLLKEEEYEGEEEREVTFFEPEPRLNTLSSPPSVPTQLRPRPVVSLPRPYYSAGNDPSSPHSSHHSPAPSATSFSPFDRVVGSPPRAHAYHNTNGRQAFDSPSTAFTTPCTPRTFERNLNVEGSQLETTWPMEYNRNEIPWSWPVRGERKRGSWEELTTPTKRGRFGFEGEEKMLVDDWEEHAMDTDVEYDENLATRYVRIENLPTDCTEKDLNQLFVERFTSVKGCYTYHLSTLGVVVLVFHDVRSALAAVFPITSTPLGSRPSLRAFCISRQSFTMLNIHPQNPLISASEGVLVLTLRGNQMSVSPTAIIQSFGDIWHLKLVDEHTFLVEFWDERSAETAKKALDGLDHEGTTFLGTFEPDVASTTLTMESANVLTEQQDRPQMSNSKLHFDAPSFEPQLSHLYSSTKSAPTAYYHQASPPLQSTSTNSPPSSTLSSNTAPFTSIGNTLGRQSDNFRRERLSATEPVKSGADQRGTRESRGPTENYWRPDPPRKFGNRSQDAPPPSWGIYRDEKIPVKNLLQFDRIERGLDVRTTLMLKNIPNRMTDVALMEYIDAVVGRSYDFFYLRIDFSTECTVGYGFVNFTSVDALLRFAKARLGTRWNSYGSDKICVASYANIQGKENLVARFKNSSVMSEAAAFRPKIFYSSGPLAGQPELFPTSDDPNRKARSTTNTRSNGLFPSSRPVFKIAQALGGLHM